MTARGVVTRSLVSLPTPNVLVSHAKGAALLDAALKTEPAWRVFACATRRPSNYSVLTMDDRQGDRFTAALRADRAFVVGYNEASPISDWPANKLDPELLGDSASLPRDLQAFLGEREFDHGGRTFACWYADSTWQVPHLLLTQNELQEFRIPYLDAIIDGPSPFLDWVHEYYETDAADAFAAAAFAMTPLRSSELAARIGRSSAEAIRAAAEAIDYPLLD